MCFKNNYLSWSLWIILGGFMMIWWWFDHFPQKITIDLGESSPLWGSQPHHPWGSNWEPWSYRIAFLSFLKDAKSGSISPKDQSNHKSQENLIWDDLSGSPSLASVWCSAICSRALLLPRINEQHCHAQIPWLRLRNHSLALAVHS